MEAVVNDAMFPAFMDGKRELVLSGQARNVSRAAVIEEVKVEQVRGERLLDIG